MITESNAMRRATAAEAIGARTGSLTLLTDGLGLAQALLRQAPFTLRIKQPCSRSKT